MITYFQQPEGAITLIKLISAVVVISASITIQARIILLVLPRRSANTIIYVARSTLLILNT